MRQHIIQINALTGEKIEGSLVNMPAKKTNGFKMWIALNQESFSAICSPDLSGSDRRVLLALVCFALKDNQIPFTQKYMAEQLDMEASNFTRCVSRLIKLGFVVKEQKVGHNQSLALSIDHFWRGDSLKHKNLRAALYAPKRAKAKEAASV
jgi:hypothetical protein